MSDEVVESDAPERIIRVAEPMTRFECNQKGCCCQGWKISFDADDTYDLIAALPKEQQEGMLRGSRAYVDGETQLCTHIQLKPVGPKGACRFLEGGGRCSIHATIGPQVLPNLCRVYPAFSYRTVGSTSCFSELHFDPVCPEVLERIDESDGPYEIVEIKASSHRGIAERSVRSTVVPPVRIGDVELSFEELAPFRETIIAAFNDRSTSAMDTLAWVSYAMSRLGDGSHPTELRVEPVADISAFHRYFDVCVSSHQGQVLSSFLRRYRRFIFAAELPEGSWDAAEEHLDYRPDWRDFLNPQGPPFDGLIARYLAHRFFDVFDPSRGDAHLNFRYRSVAHGLAAALRIAVGIGAWLDRPVDRPTLKVAIGVSEYFFRSVSDMRVGMPWFTPDFSG